MSGRGVRFLWIVTFMAFYFLFVCVEKLRLLIGVGGGWGEVVGIFVTFWALYFLFVCVEKLRFCCGGLARVDGDVLDVFGLY